MRDGAEKIYLGGQVEILTSPPKPCMAKFHVPTPTRNDVGNHYCGHVPQKAPRAIPTGILQMPPTLEHELPYQSSLAIGSRKISGIRNAKLCTRFSCI
jgi:hypothetical protein